MNPTRTKHVADPDGKPTTKVSRVEGGVDHLLAGFAAIAENQSLQTVLERVVSAACQLVDAKFAALGVIGPDGALSHFITVGLDEDRISRIDSLPVGHGVLGLLITKPEPLRLRDLRKHPSAFGFPTGHPQMTSFLGVPIRVRNGVFGNLYLTEKKGGEDFSEADEELTVALAAAAGIAIENMRLFEDATDRSRWLESGQDAVRALLDNSQEHSLSDVELIAGHAQAASKAALVLVLTRLATEQSFYCEVALGEHGDDFRGRIVGGSLTFRDAIPAFGDLSLLTGAQMKYLLPSPEAAGFETAMCTRIIDRGNSARFLVMIRTRDAQSFSDVDQRMATAFTSQVSLALELVEVQKQREQDAVFGDRDRIARDLHDLVIQRIFAAGLSIQSLRKHVTGDEPLARIAAVTAELDSAIRELRDTIYSLEDVRGDATLSSQILTLVQQAFDGSAVEPVVHFSGRLDSAVREGTATQLKAILREALSNVVQHSGAATTTIYLSVGEHTVRLEVADNGRGFTQDVQRSGLDHMQERAEGLGGEFELESVIGQGTKITVTLPLSP